MTDAALRAKLEQLEQDVNEKRNVITDHLKTELRKMKEDHGRKELLGSLDKFPTLCSVGRTFVEDLPATADDTAAALLEAGLPVGPKH